MEAATFRDWDGLPRDLLASIGELLDIPSCLWFRGVCRSWRAALPEMPSPWLVVHDGLHYTDVFTFLSLPTGGYGRWMLWGARCIGSSGGWLAFVDLTLAVTLLNPLTQHAHVRLPLLRREERLFPLCSTCPPSPTHRYPGYYIGKERRYEPDFVVRNKLIQRVAFSGNPTAEDHAVAVLCRYGLGLGFTRAGLDGWQWLNCWPDAAGLAVPGPSNGVTEDAYNADLDIAYHDGRFYYMTLCGRIWSFDAAAPPPVVPVPFAKCRPPGPDHRRYGKRLVFTRDGALHVVWSDGPGLPLHARARARWMHVQRYEPGSARHRRWTKARHLGGRAFLIGTRNQSVAVVPAAAPSTWVRPDCVYFTDLMPGSDTVMFRDGLEHDIWEFDVKTGDFRACDRGGFQDWWESDWPKAIWFTPSVH